MTGLTFIGPLRPDPPAPQTRLGYGMGYSVGIVDHPMSWPKPMPMAPWVVHHADPNPYGLEAPVLGYGGQPVAPWIISLFDGHMTKVGHTYQIKSTDGGQSWSWVIVDEVEPEPEPCNVPELDVEFGPQNWSLIKETVHVPAKVTSAVLKRWNKITAIDIHPPKSPGLDFTHVYPDDQADTPYWQPKKKRGKK